MKTGTSAFAAHLSRRASAGTLPTHIIYPTGDLWFPARGGIVKHHDLVEVAPASLSGTGDRHRKTDATVDGITERFTRISAAARQRREDVLVVFVCEIADQRATPELAKALRPFFDSVDFVIVARDQVGAVRSLLGQQIRMWNRTDVVTLNSHAFVGQHAKRGSYDYARLWEKWAQEPSDYRIHFVPYRDGAGTDDLSQDIFTTAGFGQFPHSPDLVNGDRIHSTFSTRRMRELALLKRWANRGRVIPGVSPLGKWLFELTVRRAHKELSRDAERGIPTWRLPRDEQEFIQSTYRESNEKFQRLLGTDASKPGWRAWFEKTLGTPQ
jgi:hypothetical protein